MICLQRAECICLIFCNELYLSRWEAAHSPVPPPIRNKVLRDPKLSSAVFVDLQLTATPHWNPALSLGSTAHGFTEPLLALLCEGFEISALWAKSFEHRQRIRKEGGSPYHWGFQRLPFSMVHQVNTGGMLRGTRVWDRTHTEHPASPCFHKYQLISAWGAGGVHSTDYQEDYAVRLKIIGLPNQDLVTGK